MKRFILFLIAAAFILHVRVSFEGSAINVTVPSKEAIKSSVDYAVSCAKSVYHEVEAEFSKVKDIKIDEVVPIKSVDLVRLDTVDTSFNSVSSSDAVKLAQYESDNSWPVAVETHFVDDAIITAYCSCEKCCGKWALNRPNGVVYTSTGEVAIAGVTVAADPNKVPYGSHVVIDGHEYIVQDTGSGLKGDLVHIDIYCSSHQEALNIGRTHKSLTWWTPEN